MLSLWRQDGYCAPMLPPLLAYFSNDPDYRDATEAIRSGEAQSASPAAFGKDVAAQLYGRAPFMSASRLEQYARCPFAQYVKYGLRAEERKVADETASDAGTFLHDALDAFVREAKKRGFELGAMTESDVDTVLDAVLPELLVTHNDGLFGRDARLRESLFLRLRTVRLAANSIVQQLHAGRFDVAATELSFGMDGSSFQPISLTLKDGFDHDAGTNTYTKTFENVRVGSYIVTETTKDIDGKDVVCYNRGILDAFQRNDCLAFSI